MPDPNHFDLTAGPWYGLPWWRKTGRWMRHQPLYKVSALWSWLRYTVGWYAVYRRYPMHPEMAPDRVDPNDPEMGAYVHPRIMWEITVAQDARELERYWSWESKPVETTNEPG